MRFLGGRKHSKRREGRCFDTLNERHCTYPKSFQVVSRDGHHGLAANRQSASKCCRLNTKQHCKNSCKHCCHLNPVSGKENRPGYQGYPWQDRPSLPIHPKEQSRLLAADEELFIKRSYANQTVCAQVAVYHQKSPS